MAFNSPNNGDVIRHTDITQFVNSWTGVAGAGIAFENTTVSDSAKYAGDFRNQDSTNGYVLRARNSANDVILQCTQSAITLGKTITASGGFAATISPTTTDTAALGTTALMWSDLFLASGAVVNFNNGDVTLTHSANTLAFAGGTSYTFDAAILPSTTDGAAIGSATVMWSDLFLASGGVLNFNNGNMTITHGAGYLNVTGGILYVNDTANTNMTTGLTINQAGADNEILALKSSDVGHSCTTDTEADSYLIVKKANTAGGCAIKGYGGAALAYAVGLDGIAAAQDATRSTAGVAPTMLTGARVVTNTAADLAADQNLIVIRNRNTTVAIFDSDGDLHLDATSYNTVWDDYDDLALLESFRAVTTPNYKALFAQDIQANSEILARTGVLTLNSDGHHFYSRKAMDGLLIDALRQSHTRLTARIDELESKLTALGAN